VALAAQALEAKRLETCAVQTGEARRSAKTPKENAEIGGAGINAGLHKAE
jgi:hypothetical protein